MPHGNLQQNTSTNGSGVMIESSITDAQLATLSGAAGRVTFAMNDNQAAPATIFTVPVATSKHYVITYSLARTTAHMATGQLLIINNGSTAAIDRQEIVIGTPGVTLSVTISGADMLLQYTSTATGSAPTFQYRSEEWT